MNVIANPRETCSLLSKELGLQAACPWLRLLLTSVLQVDSVTMFQTFSIFELELVSTVDVAVALPSLINSPD